MNTRICGAKTRKGGVCQRRPLPNGKCKFHGGKSLSGIESPSFKTGRYSKYLPERLQERYQEAVSDSELLALREDISLLDARLSDVLVRVDTGESGAIWKLLSDTYAEMERERDKNNPAASSAALLQIKVIIEQGLQDYAVWGEIISLLDQRRKLVESERKRLVEMRQVVTAERIMLFISALTEIIRRHVTDSATRAAIATDLSRLVTVDAGAGDNGIGSPSRPSAGGDG